MKLIFEQLNKQHNRTLFDCGVPALNQYLLKTAKQDQKRRLAVVYVLADAETKEIKGFYTLSSNAINRSIFPEHLLRKLPYYEQFPTILIGRLAIDQSIAGKGYGKHLMMNALVNCYQISKQIGSLAVIVDPKDQAAIDFYERFDFILLPGSKKMFLPMKTIADLVE